MARRAGSLANEITDYSDRRIFTGPDPMVPTPFARHEDFIFTAHGALLAPTSNMLALLDPGRPLQTDHGSLEQQHGAVLDLAATAMLERELLHCVSPKSVLANEPAGPLLRESLLWGRFSEVSGDAATRQRAAALEEERFQQGIRHLFLEADPTLGAQAFRYGWTSTLILERFAQTAEHRQVATAAWLAAAQAHRFGAVHAGMARLRKAHQHMAEIAAARAQANEFGRARMVQLHGEAMVNLSGQSSGVRRR